MLPLTSHRRAEMAGPPKRCEPPGYFFALTVSGRSACPGDFLVVQDEPHGPSRLLHTIRTIAAEDCFFAIQRSRTTSYSSGYLQFPGRKLCKLSTRYTHKPHQDKAVSRATPSSACREFGLAITLMSSGILTAHAQSLHGKADLFLTRRNAATASGWTSVIAKCPRTLTPDQARQIKASGGNVSCRLDAIHSLTLRVPTRNLHKLAALPFVQHLSSNTVMHKTDEFTVKSSGAGMAFQQYGLTGQSVRVAVLDSGIHNQPDFGNQTISSFPKPVGSSNRLVARLTLFLTSKGNVNSGSVDDKCGHGTHVAGIFAGNGTNSSQVNCYRHFFGIAPQADLLNVRVLDQNGQGTVSQVLAGIQWVLNNQAKYNIRIINLSVGHPVGESYTTDPLCQMVEQAWKKGIVVVVAAGNEGRFQDNADLSLDNEGYGTAYGSIQSPGNDPYVITVGAMKATDMVVSANGTWTHNRNNDRIATYSSRGPSRLDLVMKPDIVAPGNKVISTDADNSYLDNFNGNTNDIRKAEYITKGDTT